MPRKGKIALIHQLFSSADSFSVVIETGTWDAETKTFQIAAFEDSSAIRVNAQIPDRPLFFAPVIGHDTFDSSAEAIAAALRITRLSRGA